jgi:hypothetical protein
MERGEGKVFKSKMLNSQEKRMGVRSGEESFLLKDKTFNEVLIPTVKFFW